MRRLIRSAVVLEGVEKTVLSIALSRAQLIYKRRKVMNKYVCTVCGYIYDPSVGDPDHAIPANTAFEALPDDWQCPLCGVGKSDFQVLEG